MVRMGASKKKSQISRNKKGRTQPDKNISDINHLNGSQKHLWTWHIEPLCKPYMPEKLGLLLNFWGPWEITVAVMWPSRLPCMGQLCFDLNQKVKTQNLTETGAITNRAHRKYGSRIFSSKAFSSPGNVFHTRTKDLKVSEYLHKWNRTLILLAPRGHG